VLGFYLLATAAGFQGALAALTRLALALPSSDGAKASDGATGPLLLHIDAVTGKCAAKVVSGEPGAAAAPRPAELSFGPALSNFQALATQFRLDADVPIPKVQAAALIATTTRVQLILSFQAECCCMPSCLAVADLHLAACRRALIVACQAVWRSSIGFASGQGKDDLAGECDRLLQREIQRLEAAVVAVGERVLPASQTVLEAFPSASGGEGPLHLTLFCPPTGHNHTGEGGHQVLWLCTCFAAQYTAAHRVADVAPAPWLVRLTSAGFATK